MAYWMAPNLILLWKTPLANLRNLRKGLSVLFLRMEMMMAQLT